MRSRFIKKEPVGTGSMRWSGRPRQMALAIIVIVIILQCFYLPEYLNAEDAKAQKSVLIINSYHQGFAWTKDQTDGIIEKLNKSGYNISTFVEYMDWKNYPTLENMQHFYDLLKYKYVDKDIDVLIATDDAAFRFTLENRESLFPGVPLVFCGVNQKGVSEIAAGYSNFTGVIEEVDPTDTIEIALHINPSLKNIYVLFDNSESGASTGQIVMDKIESMGLDLETIALNGLPFDELLKKVRSYDKDSIILVTTYYSDIDGRIVDFEIASREISKHSSVPVYHLYDLGLNNGAFGGVMTSGRLMGENAANLVIRILNGEDPDNISILYPEATRKVFDFQQLRKFDVSPDKLPEGSEVINKPFSFFETYKVLVFSVLSAFIVLLSFVCSLLFYIMKLKRTEKKLADSYEELAQINQEYTHLAYHDSLTGLPNKLSLYEDSKRYKPFPANSRSALLFTDMDNFKYINDTMGHAFGDQLIVELCNRLSSLLKEGCSLYRLSGDSFIIIMQDIGGLSDAEAFATHILDGLKDDFDVLGSVIHVSISIGIAMYPDHGNNIEELLKNADIAMYRAKDAGRGRYVVYDRSMNDAFAERVQLERYLHAALEKGEFEIYYQPQYDLKLNRISGIEALLRWRSPELGFVSPLRFIKVAEDTHLIIRLGEWVLRNACSFLKELHEKGFTDLNVSVNISILQLLQTDFYDMVMDSLEACGLEARYLELEITESILMESYVTINDELVKLREAGVGIALDDFGKGYSSLSYLKQLPISTLKIDKSFIDDIASGNNELLTGQIVALGRSLGKCVIAEGVEKQEQLEYLLYHKCNKIQGYLFSKPVPAKEIEKLLASNQEEG